MPLSLGSALQDALESSMAWRVFHFIQCSYILEGDLQYYPYKPPVPYNYMKIHFLNLVPSCKSVGKRLQRPTSVRSSHAPKVDHCAHGAPGTTQLLESLAGTI